MKTLIFILMAVALVGCAPKPVQQPKYEMLTLNWADPMPEQGLVSHVLLIHKGGADGSSVVTNVATLDELGDVLGGYGWKVIGGSGDGRTVIFERLAVDDKLKFQVELINPNWK